MKITRRYQQGRMVLGICFLVVVTICLTNAGMGQELPKESAKNKLRQGIDMFYMAKFESSVRLLREALLEGTLGKSEQFDAYLHIGFSLIRQDEDPELIDRSFLEALNADPKKSLSSSKIPPDLLARFESVRTNTIGGIVVQSDPPNAATLLVSTEYDVELLDITPVVFENLLVGEYDLLVSKDTYKQEVISIIVKPGVIDTMLISLVKKPKPIYKRWWTWGGGIVLATALAIATSGDSDGKPLETKELPTPPNRL